MLPVFLAQEGRAAHIFASDIREGPLRGAAALVEEAGVGDAVSLRLTDGLAGFTRADADCVVIAGMGGETIVSILRTAPWLREGVILILSPHTKQEVLRRYLSGNGFAVRRELLVRDAGRIYPILTAEAGESARYSEAELHTGLLSQIGADPLFPARLDELIRRAASAAPYDREAAGLCSELRDMKERL